MLSKPLIFFTSILTALFVLTAYFPRTVAAQILDTEVLIGLPNNVFTTENRFIVYGRAPTVTDAGIVDEVAYIQVLDPEDSEPKRTLPDLELFFEFGGTLELLTTDLAHTKHDVVMSEIMWGRDTSYRRITDDDANDDLFEPPHDSTTYTQWIELYNTSNDNITVDLFLLFTPFKNYPDRETVVFEGDFYRVLDAVSTLDLGKWELPGKTGRRPNTSVISAYRNIVYSDGVDGVPFGSSESSWKPTQENGRRNILVKGNIETDIERLPYIATPGAPHVSDTLFERPLTTIVDSGQIIINEVRNDISSDNFDWVELKNVSRSTVRLENWELSIVTGVGQDNNLVDLPDYDLAAGEILLLQREDPYLTILADGIDIAELESRPVGAIHKYFVAPKLNLPNTGKFVLLLRSESDKNGQDAAIEDYAGNGFFTDTSFKFNTKFWPRKGQTFPTEVADFGTPTFGSIDTTWARMRYRADDGHHKDAWQEVGNRGGIGYAPGIDKSISLGTPGYENNALKTRIDDRNPRTPAVEDEYNDGEISISEIMYDPGPNRNSVQWIELYNSSMTQAINLKGWELEIRNLHDEKSEYIEGNFEFEEAFILPNQALLLVSKTAATDVPENRVYNLHRKHRRALGLTNRARPLLSPTAFYVKLTDKADPDWDGDDIVVDEVGNLKIEGGRRNKAWELPQTNPERRRSLLRFFEPNNGMKLEGWRQFSEKSLSLSFYGFHSDLASPGYRSGGPLPVELSSFRPVRLESGKVLIRWRTESELNNAGFNILRSERRDGNFTVINAKGIIPGHGTTSEQHLYSYTDTTAKPNVIYYYRIEDVSFDGERQTLAAVRLKGDISAVDKLTTTWSGLKALVTD